MTKNSNQGGSCLKVCTISCLAHVLMRASMLSFMLVVFSMTFFLDFLQIRLHKIASRCGAPRPPMTDVGTETAFRLDQRKSISEKVNIS